MIKVSNNSETICGINPPDDPGKDVKICLSQVLKKELMDKKGENMGLCH